MEFQCSKLHGTVCWIVRKPEELCFHAFSRWKCAATFGRPFQCSQCALFVFCGLIFVCSYFVSFLGVLVIDIYSAVRERDERESLISVVYSMSFRFCVFRVSFVCEVYLSLLNVRFLICLHHRAKHKRFFFLVVNSPCFVCPRKCSFLADTCALVRQVALVQLGNGESESWNLKVEQKTSVILSTYLCMDWQ